MPSMAEEASACLMKDAIRKQSAEMPSMSPAWRRRRARSPEAQLHEDGLRREASFVTLECMHPVA